MEQRYFTNNATTTVVSDSGTTLQVTSALTFPTQFPFYATLVNLADQKEIIKVTASPSANTWIVVRAQEGTTTRTYPAGSKAELRLTAATINEVVERLSGPTFNVANDAGTKKITLTAGPASTAVIGVDGYTDLVVSAKTTFSQDLDAYGNVNLGGSDKFIQFQSGTIIQFQPGTTASFNGTTSRLFVEDPTQALQASNKQYVDRYADLYRNLIINGDCSIAQRPTNVSIPANSSGYLYGQIDRWAGHANGLSAALSVGTAGIEGGDNPGSYAFRLSTVGSIASLDATDCTFGATYAIEGYDCVNQFGKEFTVSFLFKSGAGAGSYSFVVRDMASNTLYRTLFNYTGGWQRIIISLPANNLSNGYAAFDYPGYILHIGGNGGADTTGPAQTYWAGGNRYITAGSVPWLTSGNNAYIYVTELQFESGSQFTGFKKRPRAVEESLCKRYFQKLSIAAMSNGAGNWGGSYQAINYPVAMCKVPTKTHNISGDVSLLNINLNTRESCVVSFASNQPIGTWNGGVIGVSAELLA